MLSFHWQSRWQYEHNIKSYGDHLKYKFGSLNLVLGPRPVVVYNGFTFTRNPHFFNSKFDLFQTFHQLATGSLPAILRKAMVKKFLDFDEYQLAKYNKIKKPKKKEETKKV